jgi:hypothetical protein
MPSSGAYVLPSGGVLYGPFSRIPFLLKYWWVPAALIGIAGALILFNAVALLSPVFFAAWVGVFPWVLPLGYFGFIIGVVLALVIIGGLVLFFLGFRVIAALLVFPAAIVSLIIGGGFIAGLLIGVLAALLVVAAQRFHL